MELYFAQCGENIKIGIARDVRARMSNLGTASALPIHLIASVKGDHHLERKLHERLAAHRVNGEWFKDCPEVRETMLQVLNSSDIPAPRELRPARKSNFGKVAKLLWPVKPAAQLASIAGTSERTAERWLSGEFEPPFCIVEATMHEIFALQDGK